MSQHPLKKEDLIIIPKIPRWGIGLSRRIIVKYTVDF